MKIFKLTVILFAVSCLYFSCKPDTEDIQPPKTKLLEWDGTPIPIEGNPFIGEADCPNKGENCYDDTTPICPQNQTQRALQDSFFVAYLNRDMDGFFDRHNWEEAFPEVELSHSTLSNLEDGTYGVAISADTTIMITRDRDLTFTSSDVVIAYRFSRERCD